MESEFTHGTVAIDKEGAVTDTLFCGEPKITVTVVIPPGVLGNFTSFDHTKIWSAYRAVKDRIEEIVKEKCAGLPTENCSITLEKSDFPTKH